MIYFKNHKIQNGSGIDVVNEVVLADNVPYIEILDGAAILVPKKPSEVIEKYIADGISVLKLHEYLWHTLEETKEENGDEEFIMIVKDPEIAKALKAYPRS